MVAVLSLFFLFLLSVCNDVADVLVVYVASHIWREGSPKVFHLEENNQKILNNWSVKNQTHMSP